MSELNLYQTPTAAPTTAPTTALTTAAVTAEMSADGGDATRVVYDPEADMLEIFFGENQSATGVELTADIILRLNRQTRQPVSLTLLHFSILTEQTEYGPRSFPLNNLDDAPEELRELALHLATTKPVSRFLKLTSFQASPTEWRPFTYVNAQPISV